MEYVQQHIFTLDLPEYILLTGYICISDDMWRDYEQDEVQFHEDTRQHFLNLVRMCTSVDNNRVDDVVIQASVRTTISRIMVAKRKGSCLRAYSEYYNNVRFVVHNRLGVDLPKIDWRNINSILCPACTYDLASQKQHFDVITGVGCLDYF